MNVVTYDLSTGAFGVPSFGIADITNCPVPDGCGVIEIPEGKTLRDFSNVDISVTPHALSGKDSSVLLDEQLDAEKADCFARLEERVALEQSRHLTKNKETIYRAKEEEVNRYRADTSPQASDYPFAEQEMAEETGLTLEQAITRFETRAAETKAALVQIDATERVTKTLIKNATELGQPKVVLQAATWPTPE